MTEPEVNKPRRFRLTLGGMIVLVAVIAVGFAMWRPKGTRIIDVKVGTGPAVKAGDRVAVHYVGKLADGKVFDSSKARGVPIDVVVGRGMVIKGWDVGLVGMKAGGIRQLTIPPEEAYGEKGHPPVIPPSSTLIFDVDLVKIY